MTIKRWKIDKLAYTSKQSNQMRFEPLIRSLKAFDAEHSYWSFETFHSPTNQTLKRFVEFTLQNNLNLESFLVYSEGKDLEELTKELRDFIPRMLVPCLKGLLDALHRQEALQQHYNRELVGWFRTQGWKFPAFPFEMEQKIEDGPTQQEGHPSSQPSGQDGSGPGETQEAVSGSSS